MLRILRYLPVHCAKGAEFAEVVGELREIWLIRSIFPGFSVDGQRSET